MSSLRKEDLSLLVKVVGDAREQAQRLADAVAMSRRQHLEAKGRKSPRSHWYTHRSVLSYARRLEGLRRTLVAELETATK